MKASRVTPTPTDLLRSRAMREWTVTAGKGQRVKVMARTPFTAAVAAVKTNKMRSFGWIIQVDAKGVERCYTSTKRVFLAAGKGWPKNMPEWPCATN